MRSMITCIHSWLLDYGLALLPKLGVLLLSTSRGTHILISSQKDNLRSLTSGFSLFLCQQTTYKIDDWRNQEQKVAMEWEYVKPLWRQFIKERKVYQTNIIIIIIPVWTCCIRFLLQFSSQFYRVESVQKQFILFCLSDLRFNYIYMLSCARRLQIIKVLILKIRRTKLNVFFINNRKE